MDALISFVGASFLTHPLLDAMFRWMRHPHFRSLDTAPCPGLGYPTHLNKEKKEKREELKGGRIREREKEKEKEKT